MTDNPGSRRGRLIIPASVAAGAAAVGIVVWVWAGALSTTSTAAEESTAPTSGTPGKVSDHSSTTLSQELLSYLTKIDEVAASIAGLAAEMESINGGFDANPREIEFLEATERLEDLVEATDALVVTNPGHSRSRRLRGEPPCGARRGRSGIGRGGGHALRAPLARSGAAETTKGARLCRSLGGAGHPR